MPNNFRITGNNYVSKAGGDGAGTTMEAPRRDFEGISTTRTSITVVATGSYKMLADSYFDMGVLTPEGTVKISGRNDGMQTLAKYGFRAQDIYFEQFQQIRWRQPIGGGGNSLLTRCVFNMPLGSVNNIVTIPLAVGENYTDCIFYNLEMDGKPEDIYERCIFINCTIRASSSITNSYLDATCRITTTTANNNNISPFTIEGYGLQIGTGPFGKISSNGISQLPGFNSIANQDFTLRADSPHLTRGIGPSHLRYAQVWLLRTTAQAGQPATTSNTWLENTANSSRINLLTCINFNVAANGNLYVAENQSGNLIARYRTDALIFASNAQELTALPVITGLNFNTDYPALESLFNSNAPEVFNNNVPRANPYTSGSAGRNPARLTALYRFSTRVSPRSNVDADWFPSDGTFLEMEINTRPRWNQTTNIGNGSPTYNPAQAQAIIATAMQVEYVASNAYFSK